VHLKTSTAAITLIPLTSSYILLEARISMDLCGISVAVEPTLLKVRSTKMSYNGSDPSTQALNSQLSFFETMCYFITSQYVFYFCFDSSESSITTIQVGTLNHTGTAYEGLFDIWTKN
jgi:hypothetical protein